MTNYKSLIANGIDNYNKLLKIKSIYSKKKNFKP